MPITYPHETPGRFTSLLGFVSSGDLGGITCYRSKRGRIVQFAKTWPKAPPTLAQLTGRTRMYRAAEQWRHFTPYQKQQWRNAAARASLCMTGYDLWVRWYFRQELSVILIIEDQTGINLLDNFTRTDPAIPPPPKFEPHELEDQKYWGRARFGRPSLLMPQNSTEYLTFLPCHHDLPDGDPVARSYVVNGPGTFACATAWNNHWHSATFDSTGQLGPTQIKLTYTWSDGDGAVTMMTIQTIPW